MRLNAEKQNPPDPAGSLQGMPGRQGMDAFSSIIGCSPAMNRVFNIMTKVAHTKSTVLIFGESGTGKELTARSIHLAGHRCDKPFVPIYCGAIPVTLMESECFGHSRGAFTGANRIKRGLFEEADGGTIFLDEVSELPLELQVKLLRALQEEEIRRLGESVTRRLDIRVLAATNKNLRKEVAAGRFREDLYFRLNVVKINLPPLRKRREDIPLLARHFLDRLVEKHDLAPMNLSPAAMSALVEQKWAGNVRALKNVIEEAAVMCEGETITLHDLPFGPRSPTESISLVPNLNENLDLKSTLKEITRRAETTLISRALEKHRQNRTHAAEALGISRRALISKIQAYGL